MVTGDGLRARRLDRPRGRRDRPGRHGGPRVLGAGRLGDGARRVRERLAGQPRPAPPPRAPRARRRSARRPHGSATPIGAGLHGPAAATARPARAAVRAQVDGDVDDRDPGASRLAAREDEMRVAVAVRVDALDVDDRAAALRQPTRSGGHGTRGTRGTRVAGGGFWTVVVVVAGSGCVGVAEDSPPPPHATASSTAIPSAATALVTGSGDRPACARRARTAPGSGSRSRPAQRSPSRSRRRLVTRSPLTNVPLRESPSSTTPRRRRSGRARRARGDRRGPSQPTSSEGPRPIVIRSQESQERQHRRPPWASE